MNTPRRHPHDARARAVAAEAGGIAMSDPDLADALQQGLDAVEQLLHRELHSELGVAQDAAQHLVDAGGKRFRPMFLLLAAQFGEPDAEFVVPAAAVVELIHLATLYHDDVMDEATMRRGAEAANVRWNNTVAILTGDFLFAQASRLVSSMGEDAVHTLAVTFSELVTGQMRETVGAQDGEDELEHYLRVVDEKTGSLIATAGQFGGQFSGAPDSHTAAFRRFGALIGAAFQIADDIIDIDSASGESGKTPGTDLREGVLTLPMLYARREEPDGEIASLLGRPLTSDSDVERALLLLRRSGGIEHTRRTLGDYVQRARDELAALPDCAAKDALASVATTMLDRTR